MSLQTRLIIIFALTITLALGIVGTASIYNLLGLSHTVETATEQLNKIITDNFSKSITQAVGNSYIRLGKLVTDDIVTFLDERGKDVLNISEIARQEYPKGVTAIEQRFITYQNFHKEELWYNTNTDKDPIENKEIIPLYTQMEFIDTHGQEVIKIVNGVVQTNLVDVSNPQNTEFKNEDFFKKTIDLPQGEIYVSRVHTWYITEEEARKGVSDSNSSWDIVPGRDTMKSGVIRFATPVYASEGEKLGIVVLSVDYRALAALTKHIDPDAGMMVSTPYEGNYILFFDDEGNTIVHPKPSNVRGYTLDGTLVHTNTIETPGGIFNLKDYNKNDTYKSIYTAVLEGRTLISPALDVQGRNKMTISIPVPYNKGEYKKSGYFGGIMMSINTDQYYASIADTQYQLDSNISVINEQIRISYRNTIIRTIFITIIVLAIGIIVSFGYTKRITKPILQLRDIALKIGAGDFSLKSDTKEGGEIGELAQVFDEMTDKLKQSQDKLSHANDELEEKVKVRTHELEKKNEEIEKFNKFAVGRELKMVEIKKEINDLKKRLGDNGDS